MTSVNGSKHPNNGQAGSEHKLMARSFVCREDGCAFSSEIRRGMAILSQEGTQVGQVAAVILDRRAKKATHILLSCLPETRGYWIIPLENISEVREDSIYLGISAGVVETLPVWQSESE